MVKTHLFGAVILAAAATSFGQQSSSTPNPQAASRAATPIELVGCVQPDTDKPESFKLSDTKTGTTYRLTGPKVKGFVWRNVRIVGGLVPSASIAAQAGAIDPTKVAMAHEGANPAETARVEPIEVSVARVQRLTGSCTPKPIQ
jgi:hypothetical protein